MLAESGGERLAVAATRRAATAEHGARWVVRRTCPPDWWVHLERLGGGFFHAPPGLAAGAPVGEALFAALVSRSGAEINGVAAGVWSACRLSLRPRHVYFPTVPVLAPSVPREEALTVLLATLRVRGAAHVVMDSFDARWQPELQGRDAEDLQRVEYVVPLAPDPAGLARRCSRHQQRHMQRGEREGWQFRMLQGEEARTMLAAVQRWAAARAADRGDPFDACVPPVALTSWDGGARWGATTFSAWRDGMPLGAALVGWANRRAFYVLGGSTPEGYACNAAAWLHWRVMCYLAEQGFIAYNLGGTPSSAVLPGDPAHGLHRFKRGFAADLVPCRSVRWTLRPSHIRAHRLARWVRARLHP